MKVDMKKEIEGFIAFMEEEAKVEREYVDPHFFDQWMVETYLSAMYGCPVCNGTMLKVDFKDGVPQRYRCRKCGYSEAEPGRRKVE